MLSQLDEHLCVLRELRSMGAVVISVGNVAATFAGPPEKELAPDERQQRNHLSLDETERDELARLRERYQMDEELGVE